MRQPGDAVALPRSGGVLDEVVPARQEGASVLGEAQHQVPLLITREDHPRTCAFFAALAGPCLVDEPVQQVQPSSQASRCHTRSHRYAVR